MSHATPASPRGATVSRLYDRYVAVAAGRIPKHALRPLKVMISSTPHATTTTKFIFFKRLDFFFFLRFLFFLSFWPLLAAHEALSC